jgi:hypothetical protein
LTLSDLKSALDKYQIVHNSADVHAAFSELDPLDKGSIDIGDFTRNYKIHQGSLLHEMQKPIKGVYHEGGVKLGGPLQEEIEAIENRQMQGSLSAPDLRADGGMSDKSRQSGSQRSQSMARLGATIAGGPPVIYAPKLDHLQGEARISDVIRARFSQWKPHKAEIYTSMPRTRMGLTPFPDTRHILEPSMPLAGSYLDPSERFKTTSGVHQIFSVPDPRDPQVVDAMRKHAQNEFKVERIRQRQRDFTERCDAANRAAREFDELKIARKAMNQLNYERRCQMSCA